MTVIWKKSTSLPVPMSPPTTVSSGSVVAVCRVLPGSAGVAAEVEDQAPVVAPTDRTWTSYPTSFVSPVRRYTRGPELQIPVTTLQFASTVSSASVRM